MLTGRNWELMSNKNLEPTPKEEQTLVVIFVEMSTAPLICNTSNIKCNQIRVVEKRAGKNNKAKKIRKTQ